MECAGTRRLWGALPAKMETEGTCQDPEHPGARPCSQLTSAPASGLPEDAAATTAQVQGLGSHRALSSARPLICRSPWGFSGQ